MAEGALVASLVLSAGSAYQSTRAAKAQNSAQKKAAQLERGRAALEQRTQTRKAIAAARRQRGEILASTQSQNTGGNSAVSGAVGGLQTGTAVGIGASRVQLAARQGQSLILQRGASRANRLNSSAAILGGLSSIAGAGADYLQQASFNKKLLARSKPEDPSDTA